jgi:hypothetical protein
MLSQPRFLPTFSIPARHKTINSLRERSALCIIFQAAGVFLCRAFVTQYRYKFASRAKKLDQRRNKKVQKSLFYCSRFVHSSDRKIGVAAVSMQVRERAHIMEKERNARLCFLKMGELCFYKLLSQRHNSIA